MNKRIVPLTVEELEQRELLSAASNLFLSRVYQDLLQRSPDPVGMTAWGGMLDRGSSRETVALGIQGSLEYRTNQVRDLYATLLGRSPDPLGLTTLVPWLEQGGTSDAAQVVVLRSPEYY